MNLKDIQAHRHTCLIHGKPILPRATNRKFTLSFNEEGLLVTKTAPRSTRRKVIFKYDGTYERDEGFATDLKSPFYVYMMCDECYGVPILKSRSLGFTTLTDIKYIQNYYTFILMGDASGNYALNPINEKVKYHRDGKFYHLDVDLDSKAANFKMGSNNGDDILGQLLDGMMSLDVPHFDVANVKDLEQLISKFKLYNLFS